MALLRLASLALAFIAFAALACAQNEPGDIPAYLIFYPVAGSTLNLETSPQILKCSDHCLSGLQVAQPWMLGVPRANITIEPDGKKIDLPLSTRGCDIGAEGFTDLEMWYPGVCLLRVRDEQNNTYEAEVGQGYFVSGEDTPFYLTSIACANYSLPQSPALTVTNTNIAWQEPTHKTLPTTMSVVRKGAFVARDPIGCGASRDAMDKRIYFSSGTDKYHTGAPLNGYIGQFGDSGTFMCSKSTPADDYGSETCTSCSVLMDHMRSSRLNCAICFTSELNGGAEVTYNISRSSEMQRIPTKGYPKQIQCFE